MKKTFPLLAVLLLGAPAEAALKAKAIAKLSGLATETTPGTARSLVVDAVREALDAFGPERCLYGSDWPVMTLATDYAAWLDVVHDALATHPATAADAVLHDNAVRTYRTRSRGNVALSRHGKG